MAQDDHQRQVKLLNTELNSPQNSVVQQIAGCPRAEDIPQSLVKHQFVWHTRVLTAQYEGEGLLACRHRGQPSQWLVGVLWLPSRKAPVAVQQARECLVAGHGAGLVGHDSVWPSKLRDRQPGRCGSSKLQKTAATLPLTGIDGVVR